MNPAAYKVSPGGAESSKNRESEYSETRVRTSGAQHETQRTQLHSNDRGVHFLAESGPPSNKQQEPEAERIWEKMAIRVADKIILVRFQDVFWFQSKGNLLYLHLEDKNYNCRMTMKDLVPRLAPDHFLRVHRNAIVNLDHVAEFDLPRCGNAFARFRNGSVLPISRAGRIEVRRSLLGHHSH